MTQPTDFIRRHLRAAAASGVAVVALAGGDIAYAATASGPSPAKAPAPTGPPVS